MIPKMDYVVVTYQDRDTIEATIDSIIAQENVREIIVIISDRSKDGTKDIVERMTLEGKIDMFYPENVGLAFARQLAIDVTKSDWFVFVDADVELAADWAVNMWDHLEKLNGLHIGGIFGCLYRNEEHAEYLSHYTKIKEENKRMFTHNTMIKRDLVLDWLPDIEINAYEDYLLTQHIISKGYKCFQLPVISFHNHSSSLWKEAIWGGAGAKLSGFYTGVGGPIKYMIGSIYGGLKRTLRQRKGSFLKYSIMIGVGMVWGYLRANKYRKKV